MKRILTLLTCLLLWSMIKGQNLVPNPSFEDYLHCPSTVGQVDSMINWYAVSQTPDYFNSCASSSTLVSVPYNFCGYQTAHYGGAYCGMFTYYPPNYREYIGIQLSNTLLIGQNYFVSFYLSLSHYHHMGTNKFGCKLSTVPFIYNNLVPNNNAVFYSDSIIRDTVNWVFIKGSFIADSTYNYIAFGNFFDDAHVDTLSGGGANSYHGYVLIDDVCLTTDSTLCIDNTVQISEIETDNELKAFPNPCHDIFTISLLNR